MCKGIFKFVHINMKHLLYNKTDSNEYILETLAVLSAKNTFKTKLTTSPMGNDREPA